VVSSFFPSPILSGHRLDVYHTSTHDVALVRIQNAGFKCAACGSLKIQNAKITQKKSPAAHHRTTLSGYIFATKANIDHRKKNLLNSNISSTCPHGMVNVGSLTAEISLGLGSLGHPSKFQWVLSLGFITAPTSLNGSQPNFARCLAVSWAATLYMHFEGFLPPNGILPDAKFTCIVLYWQHYCTSF